MSAATGSSFRKTSPATSTLLALRASYGEKAQLDLADSYVSRFVYRPVSFYMTVPFVWLGCSANQVTVLRAVVAAVSAVLVAFPSRILVVIGSSLYACCVLLDYVDGNLARLHGNSNDLGALLEDIADQVGPALLPVGLGVGLYFRSDRVLTSLGCFHWAWILVAGVLTSTAYCMGRMATLYIRLTPREKNTRPNAALDVKPSIDKPSIESKTFRIAKVATREGIYLATVVGLLLAASMDVMSLYLFARAARNACFAFVWSRRLAAHLQAEANDRGS